MKIKPYTSIEKIVEEARAMAKKGEYKGNIIHHLLKEYNLCPQSANQRLIETAIDKELHS